MHDGLFFKYFEILGGRGGFFQDKKFIENHRMLKTTDRSVTIWYCLFWGSAVIKLDAKFIQLTYNCHQLTGLKGIAKHHF